MRREETLPKLPSLRPEELHMTSDGKTPPRLQEKDSTSTRFEKVNKMYVGDKLIVTDSTTNQLTTIEITGLEMEHAQKVIYSMDFEPSDLFLVDIGDGDFSVMHNSCWCPWTYCGYWCNSYYCGCGNVPLPKI